MEKSQPPGLSRRSLLRFFPARVSFLISFQRTQLLLLSLLCAARPPQPKFLSWRSAPSSPSRSLLAGASLSPLLPSRLLSLMRNFGANSLAACAPAPRSAHWCRESGRSSPAFHGRALLGPPISMALAGHAPLLVQRGRLSLCSNSLTSSPRAVMLPGASSPRSDLVTAVLKLGASSARRSPSRPELPARRSSARCHGRRAEPISSAVASSSHRPQPRLSLSFVSLRTFLCPVAVEISDARAQRRA
uniref:Uncharacterized protein n=1 Tax=Zea mays TaxID=4577 RepID=A0A804MJ33_MAIZE